MEDNYGKMLWVIGHKLTAIRTTGTHGFADVVVTPGVPGPPPHYHAKAEELYYVVDGEVEIMKGETWHRLSPGESIRIPEGTLHSFRNPGDTPSRFITMHDPGDDMDALFLSFGIPVEEPNSFERSVSDELIAAFAAAAADHDMVIVAPQHAH